MGFKNRKFEVVIGDDTWAISTVQDSERRKGSALIELVDQQLSYDELREKFEKASRLKKALLGILDTDIISDKVPNKDSLQSIMLSTPFPVSEEYGMYVKAVLTPLQAKEVKAYQTPSEQPQKY